MLLLYLFCSILKSRDFVTRAIGAIRPSVQRYSRPDQAIKGSLPAAFSPITIHTIPPPSRACRYDGLKEFPGSSYLV